MSKQIILVGGAPTVGKSTIAQALASHFKLPWISTDQIRDIMRTAANKTDHPKLFSFADYTPEQFLTSHTAEQTADLEYTQSKEIWLGVKKFITDDYTWKAGFIVEGISILPHLVAESFADQAHIKAVFIGDEDEQRMRDVVFTRGGWTRSEQYPDHVKDKEVEWAALYSARLKIEAAKFGYPWADIEKNEDDLSRILLALGK